MRDYGRFCPVALATDVLADPWTPMIVRELILGNRRFNDIARGLPGISRSLLVQRLKHLERFGVLERVPPLVGRGNEYVLTPAGKDLERVIMLLGEWTVQWLYQELRPEDVDVVTLTWWMHRMVDEVHLPATSRVVVQFDHTSPQRQSIWMLLDRGDASVCIQHPGMEPDIVLRGSTPAFAHVFNGLVSWPQALRDETISYAGPPNLMRSLTRWFRPSPFANAMSAASNA